ncbi:MAG: tetratricopeptide repeat protein [Planctomycetota bacterium]
MWALLLVLLPALVFSNALRNDYHLDDIYRIRDNVEIERVAPVGRHFFDPRTSATLPQLVQYRPLLPLSLSLTAWAGDRLGLDRRVAHRLGNLALHVATALLLAWLFGELLGAAPSPLRERRRDLGGLAALLFAVHPVAGVPVNYLCARDLLLMNLFLTATLLTYVRMRRRGDSFLGWAGTVLFLVLSLFSKTNSAIAFALVFAVELVHQRSPLRAAGIWVRTAAVGAVCYGFFLWTSSSYVGFSDADQLVIDRSPLEYPLAQAQVHLFYYLRNAVWPFALRPLPEFPLHTWQAVLGGLVVAVSLVWAWRARRRAPAAALGVLFYWLLFSLTSSVIPLRSLATDYRQVPSLGFLLLALVAFLGARLSPRALVGAGVLLVGWFGAGTYATNRVWLDGESLWGQSVSLGGTALAHMNYGYAVQDRDPVLAEEHYQQALLREPDHVYARINLGLLRIRQGNVPEGLAQLQHALRVRSDWGLTHYYMSVGHGYLGNREQAARASARAAELDPRNAEYLYQAARDAQVAGDAAGSLPFLERLAQLAPDYKDALFLEGFARQTSRPDLAIDLYRRFLETSPDHVQARFNLAHALKVRGDFRRAADGFERCLELRPSYAECHYHLADCYDRLGDPEKVTFHRGEYQAALSRDR